MNSTNTLKITLLPFLLLFLALACTSKDEDEKDDCIDPAKINAEVPCTLEYAPVCGCDNETYGNACAATNNGVLSFTQGECAEGGS